mgnify:CR=1 FL=1
MERALFNSTRAYEPFLLGFFRCSFRLNRLCKKRFVPYYLLETLSYVWVYSEKQCRTCPDCSLLAFLTYLTYVAGFLVEFCVSMSISCSLHIFRSFANSAASSQDWNPKLPSLFRSSSSPLSSRSPTQTSVWNWVHWALNLLNLHSRLFYHHCFGCAYVYLTQSHKRPQHVSGHHKYVISVLLI